MNRGNRIRTIAIALTLLGTAASVFHATGCGNNAYPDLRTEAPCDCRINDVVCHCISLRGCIHDGDCPGGTVCTIPPDGGTFVPEGAEQCAASTQTRCAEIITTTGSYNTCSYVCAPHSRILLGGNELIGGFGVAQMPLKNVAANGDPPTFSWTPPEGTRFVSCMLLNCPPSIEYRLADEDEPTSGRLEISDFSECVLHSQILDSATGTFTIPRTTLRYAKKSCPSTPLDAEHPRLIYLAVGCMAYGDASMLAASQLIAIDPATMPVETDLFAPTCDAEHEGYSCAVKTIKGKFLSNDTLFGVCHEGACRTRCSQDADCIQLGPTQPEPIDCPSGTGGGGGAGGQTGCNVPTFHCVKSNENDYLGACVVEEQMP